MALESIYGAHGIQLTVEELSEYEKYGMNADKITTGLADARAEAKPRPNERPRPDMLKDGLSVFDVSKYTGLYEFQSR